ncbi:MFS transporter [Priestia megaterium]|uniref:MFS transporter n=1 Tax=Priestia megaterium TaxID=1404 RepID=A0AAX6BT82_PRIMG|nr:MFS transporter [Priestia megaterium]GMG76938.1 MFS transporter [Priestia megaterium]
MFNHIFKKFTSWHVLFYVFIITVGANAIRNSFQFLLIPVANDFNVERSTIAIAMSLFIVVNGILSPIIGGIIDRYSARIVMVVGIVLLGVACLLLSHSPNIYFFIVVFGILGALGFSCIVGVPSQIYISHWFLKNRALALSILGNSYSVGLIFLSPIMAISPKDIGWNFTYLLFSLVFFIILLPLVLWAIKEPPLVGKKNQSIRSKEKPTNLTYIYKTIIHDKNILFIFLGLLVCGFSMGLIDTHFVPMMHDYHLSNVSIANNMSILGVTIVIGGITSSWMSDKFFGRKNVLSVLFFIRMMSFLILLIPMGNIKFLIFAVLFGISYTGVVPISIAYISDYADFKIIGSLIGYGTLFHQMGGVMGSYLSGLFFEYYKNYDISIFTGVFLAFIATILNFPFLQREHKKLMKQVKGG